MASLLCPWATRSRISTSRADRGTNRGAPLPRESPRARGTGADTLGHLGPGQHYAVSLTRKAPWCTSRITCTRASGATSRGQQAGPDLDSLEELLFFLRSSHDYDGRIGDAVLYQASQLYALREARITETQGALPRAGRASRTQTPPSAASSRRRPPVQCRASPVTARSSVSSRVRRSLRAEQGLLVGDEDAHTLASGGAHHERRRVRSHERLD